MTGAAKQSFTSLNPVTGEVLDAYPIDGPEEVAIAVARAREATLLWQGLGYFGREKILLAWAKLLVDRINECAQLISLETGKPTSDATLEATLAIGHLSWAARNAHSILRDQFRRPGILMANMSAKVERSPLGVVGVIGPWNHPIFTPMGSISYALAAGNTVVFKPSEFTPGVGVWLAKTFAEIAPSSSIFAVVTGMGETGRTLCESGVDKVAFTGSTTTAKNVAATCAKTLTPVLIECGGKDPVIIAADADLKLAADATLWSAMSNAGQTCIGAERVYVHEKVADQFISLIVEKGKKIVPGTPGVGNYGPATMPKQLGIIESHIEDALARGGVALLGGIDSVKPPYVEPVILTNVPEDSIAMKSETFGPVIIINRVREISEAVRLSNESPYGLGASVWSKKNGSEIASQLHCGMVAVNSTISFAAVPTVPFGGVKDSGYGRIHGPEGLLEFTYARSIVRARFQLPILLTSFGRNAFADRLVVGLARVLYGRKLNKKPK
ncbi:MAG: aldehyde dehydrogenase family protein [Actinobacteria bacterium]|nr:aldehyde dehydrogenase family protein [Actinomycetota bacterium]